MHEQDTVTETRFCSCDLDLDLDPMNLIFESDVDIVKMYVHSKNELSWSRMSNVRT